MNNQEIAKRLRLMASQGENLDVDVLRQAADTLKQFNIPNLPLLPEGYTNGWWEWCIPKRGEHFINVANRLVVCVNPGFTICHFVARKPEPHGIDWLNKAKPGVFKYKNKIYMLRGQHQCGRSVYPAAGVHAYMAWHIGWSGLEECFGTDDISDLCEATIERWPEDE